MMNGQNGGQMDPMMMMSLLGDDSSDLSDLLPLMMMNGQQGGAAGGMNPMMLMSLMGDDCSFRQSLADLDVEDSVKTDLANGDIPYKLNTDGAYDSAAPYDQAIADSMVDYDYMACKNK